MKSKSKSSAFLLAMLTSAMLTGCATGPSAPSASSQLYQPRILSLAPGQPVPTTAGLYTPQVPEIWHSPAAFQKLELQVIDLTAALNQERARR